VNVLGANSSEFAVEGLGDVVTMRSLQNSGKDASGKS
jgi:hypothetical protein